MSQEKEIFTFNIKVIYKQTKVQKRGSVFLKTIPDQQKDLKY